MNQLAAVQTSIHESKARLSELIEIVENGGEVVIARRKRPVARLVPSVPRRRSRIGALSGRPFRLGPGFDRPLATERLADEFGVARR